LIDAVGSAFKDHVQGFWPDRAVRLRTWDRGRIVEAIPELAVLEIAPEEEGMALLLDRGVAGTGCRQLSWR